MNQPVAAAQPAALRGVPVPRAWMPRRPAPMQRIDGKVLLLLLLPAMAVAGLLYSAEQHEAGLAVAGVAALIAMFIAPEVAIYGYLVLQAFDQYFTEGQTAVFTPAKALAPALLITYLVHHQRLGQPMRVSKPVVYAWLAFGAYGIVSAVFSIAPLAAARFGSQIIVQVLVMMAMLHLLNDRTRMQRAMIFTVLGSAAAATMLRLTGGVSGQYMRATLGEFANPNTTAIAFTVGLIAIPPALIYTRNMIVRIALIACAPIILIGVLQTGSRTALIAAFVSVIPAALLVKGSGLVKRLGIPLLLLALLTPTTFFVLKSGMLGPQAQDRLEALIEGRHFGHEEARFEIWSAALKEYMRHPWGFGYGNTVFAMEAHRGFYLDIHSTLISALVDGGPISLAIFVYAFVQLFRIVRRIRQPGAAMSAAICMCFVLIVSTTHTIHFSKWFWIPITMVLLVAEQSTREMATDPRRRMPVRIPQALERRGHPSMQAPPGPQTLTP